MVPVTPHTIDTGAGISDNKINQANLTSRGIQNIPSEIDNRFDNSAAGLLPALYKRYSAEIVPDETATGFISNHATAVCEGPIGLVDHALEPSIAFSPAHAPLAVSSLESRTRMVGIPEMLSRFLRVDRLNDSLRYEADIAICEGRVQQGEDMVRRSILEGGWQWGNDNSLGSSGVTEGHCMNSGCGGQSKTSYRL